MDIKKDRNVLLSFILFSLFTTIYNCVICICFCYLAWVKNWWAVLLLIPCCVKGVSFKTDYNNKEDKDE